MDSQRRDFPFVLRSMAVQVRKEIVCHSFGSRPGKILASQDVLYFLLLFTVYHFFSCLPSFTFFASYSLLPFFAHLFWAAAPKG